MRSTDECLSGNWLYGDDFPEDRIAQWYQDEAEGYAKLGAKDRATYSYGYHALNRAHGFGHLPTGRFKRVLSIGGAYGCELLPVADRIDEIDILEPSTQLRAEQLQGIPIRYSAPSISGILPYDDGVFDLVTCFGTLHHVPNVTRVVGEIFRCTKPGGFVLMREPIVSMGDWRRPRPGLTKNERGIPLDLFRRMVTSAGFRIERETLCQFSLTSRLHYLLKDPVYNSRAAVEIDKVLVAMFRQWCRRYHPRHFWHKLRPVSIYFVLQKAR